MSEETKVTWEDPAPDRVRRYKLVTPELAAKIPAMGELTEDYECDFGAITPTVKLFSPINGWGLVRD